MLVCCNKILKFHGTCDCMIPILYVNLFDHMTVSLTCCYRSQFHQSFKVNVMVTFPVFTMLWEVCVSLHAILIVLIYVSGIVPLPGSHTVSDERD